MNKEWTECYEYFKNRKFIEKPPKTLVNLKQTTIVTQNAVHPKPMSYSQEDSEEPKEQETGRTSATTRNSCGERDFKEVNNHPRDSI